MVAGSCAVKGDNGDGVWSGESGSQSSSPLTHGVTYTITCKPINPGIATFTASATVKIVPSYHEQ
jgi:hypothetical protein